MAYTNSSLIDYKKLSPNHSGKRTHTIDRITPHCVVGQLSVETLGSLFAKPSRQVSCNYTIGKDGRLALIVEEKNRSWCTSSSANDQRAITVEIASDTKHPYKMNNAAYKKFIELCVDICKRNGKTKLLWFSNKNTALNYKPKSNEMVLTVHRWFANKACPGDWLYSRLDDVAEEVTERLKPKKTTSSTKKPAESATKKDVFLPSRGYFKKGDKGKNVEKINDFYYNVFPSYEDTLKRNKENVKGNLFGENTEAWTKEFQKRTGLKVDGYIGELTLKELKKFGFKI